MVSNGEVNISYTDFYIESKSKETEKLSVEMYLILQAFVYLFFLIINQTLRKKVLFSKYLLGNSYYLFTTI